MNKRVWEREGIRLCCLIGIIDVRQTHHETQARRDGEQREFPQETKGTPVTRVLGRLKRPLRLPSLRTLASGGSRNPGS